MRANHKRENPRGANPENPTQPRRNCGQITDPQGRERLHKRRTEETESPDRLGQATGQKRESLSAPRLPSDSSAPPERAEARLAASKPSAAEAQMRANHKPENPRGAKAHKSQTTDPQGQVRLRKRRRVGEIALNRESWITDPQGQERLRKRLERLR